MVTSEKNSPFLFFLKNFSINLLLF